VTEELAAREAGGVGAKIFVRIGHGLNRSNYTQKAFCLSRR
jgi:hypothetical protein